MWLHENYAKLGFKFSCFLVDNNLNFHFQVLGKLRLRKQINHGIIMVKCVMQYSHDNVEECL